MGESISESSVGLELPFSPGGSSRLHQSPFCFEPAEPHLDKPCQGGGELSDTGPTGKSLSFPTPCPQVPVYLTVPRVTSDAGSTTFHTMDVKFSQTVATVKL